MIVSDKYRFVFVHIPKCAGTLIRNQIKDFDDYCGKYSVSSVKHSSLGTIDYAHIPLAILQEYFEQDYYKIINYFSFALLRNPFSRFPSSLAQRLKMHKQMPINKISKKNIKREVDLVIDFLMQNNDAILLPADYIHFQRQYDYIYNNEQQVVNNIYLVNQIGLLLQDLVEIIGYNFFDKETINVKANQALVYKSQLLQNVVNKLSPNIRTFINNIISDNSKEKIRRLLYTPQKNRFSELFESAYVKDFIKFYYENDIDLYNRYLQKESKT